MKELSKETHELGMTIAAITYHCMETIYNRGGGVMAGYEKVVALAVEFEHLHKDVEWGIDGEYGDWEEFLWGWVQKQLLDQKP